MPEDLVGQGSVPVPDPTKLTTDAVNASTEIFRREMSSLKDLVFERIDGDRREETQRFRTIDEKLASHDNEFSFVEDRRVEQKQDTEKAVQAALNAAKEAVHEQTLSGKEAIDKSEGTTTKIIDGLAEIVRAGQEQARRDFDDLKARVGMLEAVKRGGQELSSTLFATGSFIVALAAIAVAILK